MRKKLYRTAACVLAATMLLMPVNTAYAKTVAVVQTENGEETVTYYSVSFHANKGKAVKTTLTLAYKDTYGKLPKTTRAGYQFLGWYTKKTGGTKVTAKTVFKKKNDQVLYAHWKKIVTEETQVPENAPAEETTQSPGQEASQTPDAQPDLSAENSVLVHYTPNAKIDYKNNNYSSFLVLKNFKPQYLYCQYDYDRFIGSSGKNAGCTATADAMLASIYMDKPFSPDQEGWIYDVGATWTNSVIVDGSKSYSVNKQCQAVWDYLNEGKPVLIRVIGHSVTAIGVRSGVDRMLMTPADILIADPTDAKVKCADEMGYRVMTDANGWGLRIPKAGLPAK